MSHPRPLTIFSLIILFSLIPIMVAQKLMGADVETLIRFFPDDAFYYLQTAYHFSQNGKVSFDGVNQATGFHPLHFFFSSAVLWVYGKTAALGVLFKLNAFFLAGAFFILWRAFRQPLSFLILGSVLSLPFFHIYLYTNTGMESPWLLLTLSALYGAWIHAGDKVNSRISFVLGALVGSVLLARLDSVIPLSLLGVYFIFLQLRQKTPLNILWALCACTLVVAPYLIWLNAFQGSFLPMSSIAKYTRPRWPLSTVWRSLTGDHIVGVGMVAFSFLFPLFTLVYCYWKRKDRWAPLMGVGAMSAFTSLIYVFFFAHEPYRWYLNFSLFTAFITSFWMLTHVQFNPRWLVAVPLLTLGVNTLFFMRWSHQPTTSLALLNFARQLNNETPPGVAMATNDAGVLGYFFHGPVHNLDGLGNSLSNWNQFLSKMDYKSYSQAFHIDYLLLRHEVIEVPNVKSFVAGKNGKPYSVDRMGEFILYRLQK